ncbi:DUF4185 domain-containing protein [Mycobacterium sp. PS03-16]|uniref:DUF4185 domain-containing protein n=1 Tax=Mycobacterium sp. PS03-16 TaxID=2559611 RepID=UPI001073B2F3|nr:DUF4185 domain-containing protein [Mycobacterium sp. PS03-16]TFV55454.1 DUF4185 domain-containing protein [Mycobacterium sp. PS03-16]
MGAAAYVGRVGSLAVALGVGAAVVTGHGVAWAETGAGSPSGGSSSESSANTGPAADREAGAPSAGTADSAGDVGTDDTDEAQPADEVEDADEVEPADDEDDVEEEPVAEEPVDEEPTAGEPVAEEPGQPVDQAPSDEQPGDVAEPATLPVTTTPDRTDDHEPEPTEAAEPTVPAVTDEDEVGTIVDGDVGPVADTPRPVEDDAEPPTVRRALAGSDSGSDDTDAIAVAAASIPEAPARPTVQTLVSGLLAAVGLGPLASGMPGTPAAPPALWTLLAAARREFDRMVTGLTRLVQTGNPAPVAAPVLEPQAASVVPAAAVTVDDLTDVTQSNGWVTGPGPINYTDARFYINGTDLGIMWDNGLGGTQRQVLIAFGDTFSAPGMTGLWRNNVLFRSIDAALGDGLEVLAPQAGNPFAGSPGYIENGRFISKQIVRGIPGTIGLFGIPSFFGSEVTIIPTAGVSVPYDNELGARQYMNVMSVRNWGPAGMWTTNYSAIAYSDDNGETWKIEEDTIRSAGFLRTFGHSFISGNENFQMGAFVRGVTLDENGEEAYDGYVYSYGTPAGRFGPAYVSRVAEGDVLNLSRYEYWNGSDWVQGRPSAARPIFGQAGGSGFLGEIIRFADNLGLISLANNVLGLFGIPVIIPRGDVSEMSVQYNEYLGKYVVMYTEPSGRVVMRTSDTPQGGWSSPITVATSADYPQLYAPMIHPWSGTDQAEGEPYYLYWNLSQWGPYNVRLMQTDLRPLLGQSVQV